MNVHANHVNRMVCMYHAHSLLLQLVFRSVRLVAFIAPPPDLRDFWAANSILTLCCLVKSISPNHTFCDCLDFAVKARGWARFGGKGRVTSAMRIWALLFQDEQRHHLALHMQSWMRWSSWQIVRRGISFAALTSCMTIAWLKFHAASWSVMLSRRQPCRVILLRNTLYGCPAAATCTFSWIHSVTWQALQIGSRTVCMLLLLLRKHIMLFPVPKRPFYFNVCATVEI